MSDLFEWHPIKAEYNHHKHDVTFEEAQTVFDDPLATLFPDDDHSDDESREIIIGHSDKQRLLVVSFTQRADATRIISARRATSQERRDYEQGTIYE